MNTETQRRALAADVGDEEMSLIAVETAPVQGDVRRVEYSVEIIEVGFPSQTRYEGCPPRGQQLELNKLWPAREQLDLRLPPPTPKCSQSHSQSRRSDHQRGERCGT